MTVLGIKTHGFCPNSECLLILDAAGRAEAGVTFPVEYHFVTAMRTFKDIKSKITGVTENGLLYIIQDNRACFSGFIHFNEPVIMIPKNCFDSWLGRIILVVVTAQKIIRKFNCIEFGIYHYTDYKTSTNNR